MEKDQARQETARGGEGRGDDGMSEMIERVARALAGNTHEWNNLLPVTRNHFLWSAREAIAAMREHLLKLSGDDYSSSEFDGTIAEIDEALK
jgi:hypothetical protein